MAINRRVSHDFSVIMIVINYRGGKKLARLLMLAIDWHGVRERPNDMLEVFSEAYASPYEPPIGYRYYSANHGPI